MYKHTKTKNGQKSPRHYTKITHQLSLKKTQTQKWAIKQETGCMENLVS